MTSHLKHLRPCRDGMWSEAYMYTKPVIHNVYACKRGIAIESLIHRVPKVIVVYTVHVQVIIKQSQLLQVVFPVSP